MSDTHIISAKNEIFHNDKNKYRESTFVLMMHGMIAQIKSMCDERDGGKGRCLRVTDDSDSHIYQCSNHRDDYIFCMQCRHEIQIYLNTLPDDIDIPLNVQHIYELFRLYINLCI